MKKTLLLFLILGFLGGKTSAQSLTGDEIVGTWKVLEINVLKELPQEQLAMMAMLKDAFLKAKFTFEENHNFSFDFTFEGMAISEARWTYNEATNSYTIQASQKKANSQKLLMEIITKKEGDKILFYLSESSISLEMKKE